MESDLGCLLMMIKLTTIEVLNLKSSYYNARCTTRKYCGDIQHISSLWGLSRNTLRHYRLKFDNSGLSYDQILLLSDTELSALVYGELPKAVRTSRQETFDSLIDYFITELKRVGVTRHLLWEEYLEQDSYGYNSQFCNRLNRLKTRNNSTLTMHLDYVPGEYAFNPIINIIYVIVTIEGVVYDMQKHFENIYERAVYEVNLSGR